MFRVLTILLLVFVTAPHAKSMPVTIAAQQTAQAMEMAGEHDSEDVSVTDVAMLCCETDANDARGDISCVAVMGLSQSFATPMPVSLPSNMRFPTTTDLVGALQLVPDRPPILLAA